MSNRFLVVNADDFGFAKDVNQGILEAHTNGILTATTLMANGAAFADAVRLARATPSLEVGCHLVLIGGTSLADAGRPLPLSVPALVAKIVRGQLDPYRELRPQILRILDAGLRPLHLDTHKHAHLWPSVLEAVARLSAEFRIPWVRRPFDLPLHPGNLPVSVRLISRAAQGLRNQFQAKLLAHGCRTTDYFAGFQITGRYRTAELAALIRSLPDGLTEFMCHPGRCTSELRSCDTRLKESREAELEALTSPDVRRALEESGTKLVRFEALCSDFAQKSSCPHGSYRVD